MKAKDYLNDITEIKEMMNKSSRFISLSGLSGVLAGIYALIGAYLAYNAIEDYKSSLLINYNYITIKHPAYINLEIYLVTVALAVVLLATLTGIILTRIKAKKHNAKMWDATSRRLLINFLIPLVTGGFFSLVLIQRNFVSLTAATMLIFYGLACINASKFTFRDIKYLGLVQLILGLICTQFVGYGLYFWAFGFGVMHIVYGAIMYFKYDRTK